MNEKHAFVIAMSLAVSAFGLLGICAGILQALSLLKEIASTLDLQNQEAENLTCEVARLADELADWNASVQEELEQAGKILGEKA